MGTLPSSLKRHPFRRNERERPYWEQACLLLAARMGQGPSPRCWVTPGWVPNRDECRGWRPPRESVAETAPALAALRKATKMTIHRLLGCYTWPE
jgi:hypothetical protein